MLLGAQDFNGGNPFGQWSAQPVREVAGGMVVTVEIGLVNGSNHR